VYTSHREQFVFAADAAKFLGCGLRPGPCGALRASRNAASRRAPTRRRSRAAGCDTAAAEHLARSGRDLSSSPC